MKQRIIEFTLWVIWNACVVGINRHFHPNYSVDEFLGAQAGILVFYFSAGSGLYWAVGGPKRASIAFKFLCYFGVMFFLAGAVAMINEESYRKHQGTQEKSSPPSP